MCKKSLIISLLIMIAMLVPGLIQETGQLSFAEDAPYVVGVQLTTFVDSNRDEHELPVAIWYPAIEPEDESLHSDIGWMDAQGDMSNAPYPLIVYSHWLTGDYLADAELLAHLASQGFVVASIEHGCDGIPMCNIDRPLDVLFVMDALETSNADTLPGMIDHNNVGLMGISSGGFTALAAAGGQIDPVYYVDWAEKQSPDTMTGSIALGIASQWDAMEAYAAQVGIVERDDLWTFDTNDHIKAVLPIVPAVGWMFGEDGLANVSAPTMMFAATGDEFFSYDQYSIPLFSQIGAAEHYLISFVDYGHHIEWTPTGSDYCKEISSAFFGYYLQSNETFAEYLTADYVNQFEDLVWGVAETD